jgi:hypothetical protein
MPAELRSGEEQLWLSRLSQAPAVRLVASADHVNAALLWNSRVAAAFNWLWLDGTTYAGYDVETANVAPIITSKRALSCNSCNTTVCWPALSCAFWREVISAAVAQEAYLLVLKTRMRASLCRAAAQADSCVACSCCVQAASRAQPSVVPPLCCQHWSATPERCSRCWQHSSWRIPQQLV